MIDPFHLEAYGVTTVNYNRDIEIFPVLSAIFEGIYGENPYKSPTDMGVNMAGNCIIDDEACCEASRQEILRRYYQALNRVVKEDVGKEEVYKIELLMKQAKLTTDMRKGCSGCPETRRRNRCSGCCHRTSGRNHRHRKDNQPARRFRCPASMLSRCLAIFRTMST